MSSRAQLPHAHGGDADGGLFRGQARNKFIDAANGGGDAVDDPASAGGEVASGVAALAVRYGIGCVLAIVTFSSSAVHVCGGHASLAKRLCWAGCLATTLSVVCSQTLSCADNFRVRVAGVGAMFRDWVAMNCLMEKLPSDNNTARQLPHMMNPSLTDVMAHTTSLCNSCCGTACARRVKFIGPF